MEVDTLLFNSGLWGDVTNEGVVKDWFSAANDVVCGPSGNGRCLWKRTTMQVVCKKGGAKCPLNEQMPKYTGDAVPLKVGKKMGWGVYDAATPTSYLAQKDMVDSKHFKPYVSNELNNLLLNVICPVK